MSVARTETTATALADGRVLVAGGGNPPEASAEVFVPRTLAWVPTGPLATARAAHAAVRLADGRVLAIGGRVGPEALNSAEVYDPGSGTWSATGAMTTARQAHTATRLATGKVLVAGGLGGGHGPYRAEAELFDPATGAWAPTGSLPQGRAHHTATLLADGRVLVVGGEGAPHDDSLRDAAVYDPSLGTWAAVPQLLSTGRAAHTATALPDGTVVVVGGTKLHTGGRPQNILSSAEVFDREGRTFLPAPSMAQRRNRHTATALGDGRVLVVGGVGERIAEPTATAEVYDPTTGRWSPAAPVPEAVAGHEAVLLKGSGCGPACGKVLVVGERAASVYTPGPAGAAKASDGAGRRLVKWAVAVVGGVAPLVLVGSVVTRLRRRPPGDRAGPDRTSTHQTMEHR